MFKLTALAAEIIEDQKKKQHLNRVIILICHEYRLKEL